MSKTHTTISLPPSAVRNYLNMGMEELRLRLQSPSRGGVVIRREWELAIEDAHKILTQLQEAEDYASEPDNGFHISNPQEVVLTIDEAYTLRTCVGLARVMAIRTKNRFISEDPCFEGDTTEYREALDFIDTTDADTRCIDDAILG